MATDPHFENFVHGYLTCALWSSIDEHGEPLDAVYSVDDIAPDAVTSATEDCRDFIDANRADLEAFCEGYAWLIAGHDFWLTRNGHGAGFWDRGLGKLGKRLTDAAKVYSGSDMVVGDDGLIHIQ